MTLNFAYSKSNPDITVPDLATMVAYLPDIEKDEIVAVDVETTGVLPGAELIEVGAAIMNLGTGEVVSTFDRFVRPDSFRNRRVWLPAEIVKKTGITSDLIEQNGISPAQALTDLHKYIGDRFLVFHNANFDWKRFIYPGFNQLELPSCPIVFDTYVLLRALNPKPRMSLDALRERYGIPKDGHHRAVVDAEHTARILYRMIPEVRDWEDPRLHSPSCSNDYPDTPQTASGSRQNDFCGQHDNGYGGYGKAYTPRIRAHYWSRGGIVRAYVNFPDYTFFYDLGRDQWGSKDNISYETLYESVQAVLAAYNVWDGKSLIEKIK